jgi:hypothetical protein
LRSVTLRANTKAAATGLGSFRVWEGFYGAVEIEGLLGSLNLAGFGDVTEVGVANVVTGELGPPLPPPCCHRSSRWVSSARPLA